MHSLVASGYRLPFAAASFDLVIGQAILHHLGDKAAVAEELFRVMKPGARAVFGEPLGDSLALERLRRWVPIPSEAADDPDQWATQFKHHEVGPFRRWFVVDVEEFQLLSRLDRMVAGERARAWLGRLDRRLLAAFPALRRYARTIVVELRRVAPPGPARPSISVVVPTLNAWPDLARCLGALLEASATYRSSGGTVEVVVVDNGSTDGSYERLKQDFGTRVRVLREPGVTISRLRNRGAEIAQGSILSFVDSDCAVPPEYLMEVAAVLGSGSAEACGSPYQLPASARPIERTWHDLHVDRAEGVVSYLPAGNFAITRDAFVRSGGFREDLVTGEDAELGQRLTANGVRILRTERVRSVHHGNPRSLGAFYRQQRWHGLGQFGTARAGALDRPLTMTFVHLALLVAAAVGALGAPGLLLRAASLLVLPWLVPAATVTYRAARGGAVRGLLLPLALYQLYYLARIEALWRTVTGFEAPRR
jgi:GT2 family glycosyltransferase